MSSTAAPTREVRRAPVLTPEGVVDAVVGYRRWRLIAENGRTTLRSLFNDDEWPRGEPLVAECRCSLVDANALHTCGIYAWAEHWIPTVYPKPCYLFGTPGEVLLWPEVLVHENGYVAARGQVAALYVSDEMNLWQRTMIEIAALQYGVPVVLVSSSNQKTT